MTREEAIKILEEEAEFLYGGDEPYNKIAFNMAIEALSADTVSREQYDHVCEEYNRLVHKAVCIKLCDENCEYEKGKTCYHAREHSAIEALQAEPVKHGEWKKSTKNLMACSECGTCYLDDSVRDYFFCPNCGAKMNKE